MNGCVSSVSCPLATCFVMAKSEIKIEIMSESSDEDMDVIPAELVQTVHHPELNFLPEKSRVKYLKAYDLFDSWRISKGLETFSENILLSYFIELSKTRKSSTLWSIYSMLKATIKTKNDINIESYPELLAFLKKTSSGYKSKKSKVFTASNIEQFLKEAHDSEFLATKVALIIGISGACRTSELTYLRTKNIEKHSQSLLLVNLPDTKTNIPRNFVIRDEYVKIIEKYQACRPADTPIDRFFLQYRRGKCVRQPMGTSKIGGMPREIASFLGLQDPEQYTGHCFRRTSALLLADSGADLTTLKRIGSWKSSTLVEGYVKDSMDDKSKICKKKMGLDIKSVLVVDGVGANCQEILNTHGINVVMKAKITKEELLQEIPKYDGLVVRSASQVTKEVLEAGKRLKVVGRAGAGVDNVDVAAAGARGIAVINAPGANAMSACELTCGLVLALARHVAPAAAALRAGRWERARHTGTELGGRTLAVLGLGRVGREVALRMRAFGMTIVGFDPFVSAEQCQQFHTTKMELDEIWPVADYITLHTPLIDSTRNFINADVLKRCKKGVKIVNVGRGGLIKERDLLDALNSGQVSGAALDVFEQEPPTDPLTLEIIQHPAVTATPHLGASTKEAQIRVGQEIAEQLVNLVKPGTYTTPLAEVTRILNK